MILQCDQCNTKFRLDDSKLKPGGVKVRCSKCRHVFVAGAEHKHEESEFDALLSGLGASAASETPEAAPAAEGQQPAGAELAPLEVGAQPAEEAPSAANEDQFFGDFDLTPEPGAAQPEAGAKAPDQTAVGDFDFGEIDFGAAATAVAEPAQPAGGVDFGEFDFNEEPSAPPAEEKEAAAAKAPEFGEFSFDETPAPPAEEKEAPAAADAFDFGEFSFDETPPPPAEEKETPADADAFDFGELSFDETPAAPPREEKEAPAAADAAFDFGEFSFDETPAAIGEEKAAPAPAESPDFDEFSFDETPASPAVEKQTPAAADAFDFGDFPLEESAAAKEEEPPAAVAASDFGAFSFDEAPAPGVAPATGVAEDFGASPPAGQQEMPASHVPEPAEEFTLGDFSFAEEPEPLPAPHQAPPPAAVSAAGVLGAAEATPEAPQPAPLEKPAAASPLEFSFGAGPFATPVPEQSGEEEEEEFPPLSISSRRRGRSAFTIAVIAVSAVVVLGLSAAGLYLLQSGPAAMAKLDQLGIGFVAQWFGVEVPEEGNITVRNAQASFHQNQEAGELFVVTGEAVNSFRKPRASIQVKVSIFDKNGNILTHKTAYCGNRLSKDQLATLPMEKIESIMNNQFGDSLSNLSVKPGEAIGFVVAMANVPKDAADFGVEVVGSTVAAGQ